MVRHGSLTLLAMLVCLPALSGCGLFDSAEAKAEKKFVKFCATYLPPTIENAGEVCRCQWQGIRKEIPKEDLKEFFLRVGASGPFQTRESRLMKKVARDCMAVAEPPSR